jgi:sugar/nucleoside kinase (ribokinase family)
MMYRIRKIGGFMEFKKAVKRRQRLRLAIDGVSGSGKTYTALAIASGIGGKIAVIDTEHGSASLYADRFDFDTLELERFQIEDYIEALQSAAAAGYPIVVIDSTSHAWDALVERVDRLAGQKFGGSSFRAWSEGAPLQRKLIETMLSYPGHVIATCRSKSEYSVDKDNSGRTTIKKVGTAAVQRAGFEYEFTLAMTLDANHVGLVTKDRTSKFQDEFIERPGKEFGERLTVWLNEGEALADERGTLLNEIKRLLETRTADGALYFTEDDRVALRQECSEIPCGTAGNVLLQGIIERLIGTIERAASREFVDDIPGDELTEAPTPAQEKQGELWDEIDSLLAEEADGELLLNAEEAAELRAFCKRPGTDLAAVKRRVETEIAYRRAQYTVRGYRVSGGFHIDPNWARNRQKVAASGLGKEQAASKQELRYEAR